MLKIENQREKKREGRKKVRKLFYFSCFYKTLKCCLFIVLKIFLNSICELSFNFFFNLQYEVGNYIFCFLSK